MANERQIPDSIGDYEVGAVLGRGTCGTVHYAHDTFVGRDVALKVAHPGTTAGALCDRHRRTFLSEAHAAGQLSHPHIVPVHDAGVGGAYSYIVTEYVPGTTLRAWGSADNERRPAERAVDIVFRCCQALNDAHRRDVAHRDIKPGNIMIGPEHVTKITDFSITLTSANGVAGTPGMAKGTPQYMAPEQLSGDQVGPPGGSLCPRRRPVRAADRAATLPRAGRAEAVRPHPADAAPARRRRARSARGAVGHRRASPRARSGGRYGSGAEFAAALACVYEWLRRTGHHLVKGSHRDLLRGLHFFDGFTDAQIEAVLEASTLLQYRAGEILIREGELESSFYLLVVGSARVEKGRVVIVTLGKGDCLGEMGFLAETRRSATITADADSVVLRVGKSQLDVAPPETQLLYYRAFTETLVYRLALTSARLSAALGGAERR